MLSIFGGGIAHSAEQGGEEIDHFKAVSDEIILNIFSYLSFTDLEKCSAVSRQWRRLSCDLLLLKRAVLHEYAFGYEQWVKQFGEGVLAVEEREKAWKALPKDIYKILMRRCPVFPGKRVKNSHMLFWVPEKIRGLPVTKDLIEDLFKGYFPENKLPYNDFYFSKEGASTQTEIDASHWVLMMDIVPDSMGEDYSSQQKMVALIDPEMQALSTWKRCMLYVKSFFVREDLPEILSEPTNIYQVPSVMEAIICFLVDRLGSGERFLGEYASEYGRCNNLSKDGRVVVVGRFGMNNFEIDLAYSFEDSITGVLAMRRFS